MALIDEEFTCAVVDDRILCVMTALKEGLSAFDLARAESYARNLSLRFGITANFGKDKLELKGVVIT